MAAADFITPERRSLPAHPHPADRRARVATRFNHSKALAGVEGLSPGVGKLALQVQRAVRHLGHMIKQGLAYAPAARLDIERMQDIVGAVEASHAEQALAVSGQINLFILGGGDEVRGLMPLGRDPGEGGAQDALI